MAYNGPKQPLVSSSMNPTPQTNQNTSPKRRRDHHFSSTPSPHNVPQESNRIGSYLPHSEFIFDKLCPMFRVEVVFLALYLGVGTVFFYFFGHQMKGKKTNGVVDALYFCIVTMTTLGYGDLVPDTVFTKLLACAFVFVGMALVGLVLSKAADHLIEKQGKLLLDCFKEDRNETPNKDNKNKKAQNKCVFVLILLLLFIVSGIIFLIFVEEMNFVDAFYCVCCTIATLGYGDKSFSTKGGRVFAVFWILMSTVCLAQFFLYVADLKTESTQKKFIEQVLNRRMTKTDLESADRDGDRKVNEFEFIISKLKEMGKIKEKEDISPLREKFKQLDVDSTGTLTDSDLGAQSSGTRK